MPQKSKEAKAAYQREYIKRPEVRAKNRARNKQNYSDKIAWLDEYKTPCVICGESEKCCIDFHHIDESTKVAEVATLLRQTSKREIILEEVNKCITLCANCHRKLHQGLVTLPELSTGG